MEETKEKTFFTEITEDEKRIINLIRAFVIPTESTSSFLDFLVDVTSQKLLDKTIRLKAFTEVMSDPERESWDSLGLLARIDQYEEFLSQQRDLTNKYLGRILADMVKKLEGDILPMTPEDVLKKFEREQKTLDKIK